MTSQTDVEKFESTGNEEIVASITETRFKGILRDRKSLSQGGGVYSPPILGGG
jgi:hypothetical protein